MHPDQVFTVAELFQYASGGATPAHVLIQGEPGAGKSTLLHHIARNAWDNPNVVGLNSPYLTMIVSLRKLARTEAGSIDTRLAAASDLTLPEDLPVGFFRRWPRRMGARWLLLFDAIDQVPSNQRLSLLSWLERLVGTVEEQGHLVLLTSRPIGSFAMLEQRFNRFTLLPFTSDQQQAFAQRWFTDRTGAFLKRLDQVRGGALCGTPLLLTIAAEVYSKDGDLPERRAELYDRFVEIWLEEAKQRGLDDELGERLTKIGRRGLEHVALAMVKNPREDAMQVLSRVVAEYLQQQLNVPRVEAEIDGERFIEVMGRRSGVFIRRGVTSGWVHSTFGEYLAAGALARQYTPDNAEALTLVAQWGEEPWREVILFLLGIWSSEAHDVTHLVQPIWKSRKEGLFFAAAALADGAQVTAGVHDGVVSMVLDVSNTQAVEVQRILALLDERVVTEVTIEALPTLRTQHAILYFMGKTDPRVVAAVEEVGHRVIMGESLGVMQGLAAIAWLLATQTEAATEAVRRLEATAREMGFGELASYMAVAIAQEVEQIYLAGEKGGAGLLGDQPGIDESERQFIAGMIGELLRSISGQATRTPNAATAVRWTAQIREYYTAEAARQGARGTLGTRMGRAGVTDRFFMAITNRQMTLDELRRMITLKVDATPQTARVQGTTSDV